MHLHILGISGTFMSALALLAREAGFHVTGSDANCYPPISDLLHANQIEWTEGYEDTKLALQADLVIVGNAIKRGMPVMEEVLRARKPYTSGPQWLAENILSRYQVLAVAGTHGKTTTTSMLAFILSKAGLNPGFLIGGVASDFNTSARLGSGKFFVIEADEYDSAYFDKRPKLMHYRPEVAILNNLEFDHADIYADLKAIQLQFHYYLKTIPPQGLVIKPLHDAALNDVIAKGIFSDLEEISLTQASTWRAELLHESGSAFNIWHRNQRVATVKWSLIGHFNVENALAAVAASYRVGVQPMVAAAALEAFTPVKRRLEVKSAYQGITVYDDFAHHPTAIQKTLTALKNSQRHKRVFVVIEFASYTMRTGVHAEDMARALAEADGVYALKPSDFDLSAVASQWLCPYQICESVEAIIDAATSQLMPGDALLVMSNRGFGNIHERLTKKIQTL